MDNIKNAITEEYDYNAMLITYCSRTTINQDLEKKINYLLCQNIDWKYVFNACYYHKIIPLVYSMLKQVGQENIPPEIMDKFSSYYQKNACKSLIYVDKLVEIINALQQRDIAVLPFKGPILALLIYADLALRTFGDLDILIESKDLDEALNVLQELNYPSPVQTNRIAEQPYLNFFLFHEFYGYQKSFDIHNTNSNIIVELHWSLFNNSFAFPAEFELMWKDKINVKVEEAEIYTFGSQDLLIYLCAHASKHCWSCLQWICDIAELIRANPLLDWQKIQDKAKEMGCSRMLYIGLILAQDLLDAELSENIRQKINRDRQAKALAKEVKDRLFNFSDPKFNSYLFILRCRERYRDKLQFLICLLCVPKQEDWRFIRLPQYLHFFYYAIRPLRLLIKAGKISGNSLK